MRKFQHLHLTLLLSLTILVSGCGLRPEEKVTYVIMRPGTPLEILDNKDGKKRGVDVNVRGQDMKSGKMIEGQAINGWVTMPPEHWTVVKEKLNGVMQYEKEHSISIAPLAEVVK